MNSKLAKVLAGLVLFASGAVVGFFGSRLLGERGPLALLHGDPRHFASMALRRMSSDLDLSEEQREKLRPIIMDTARQIIAIRREQEPEIRQVIATSIELTKALLTPEQREKFKHTMARLNERRMALDRFGPPPPPPPGGFGPPPGMEGFPPPPPPPPPDLFDPEWDLPPPPGPPPGPWPGQAPGKPSGPHPGQPSGQPPASAPQGTAPTRPDGSGENQPADSAGTSPQPPPAAADAAPGQTGTTTP
ncbi:MAG: Spy/CpxP family protein refolding chaperone [Acidobacteriota bacterium]